MSAVLQWGRRESIIWPPRHYPHTLSARSFDPSLASRNLPPLSTVVSTRPFTDRTRILLRLPPVLFIAMLR